MLRSPTLKTFALISTTATYAARLKAMIGDLRADLHDPILPVVVGQLGTYL